MQCCHTGRENLPNMRKNIEKIIGLILCVGMLTGCAKTPESSLVKPKGSSAMDAYKEADDSVDMVEITLLLTKQLQTQTAQPPKMTASMTAITAVLPPPLPRPPSAT